MDSLSEVLLLSDAIIQDARSKVLADVGSLYMVSREPWCIEALRVSLSCLH